MGNPYNGFTWTERMRNWAAYKADVAAGRRQWPTVCDACGQTEGRIEPHDEDYGTAADRCCEFGVCYRCHMMIHCRFKAARAWNDYRDAVRAGKRAAPLGGRGDWGAIQQQLRGVQPSYTQHEPLPRLLLDEIHSGKWLNRGLPGAPPAELPPPEPPVDLFKGMT